jgi:CO/xanthine dehydrogenase FAD-binding subunit
VKPAAFVFHRAHSLDEALALLHAHPDAKPLAGGQSLIPAMNFRLAQPTALVDLNGVAELAGITATPEGGLRIGGMTRHLAVERSDLVRQRAPLLFETMPHVAHPQIRSRGTLGGSLAHADPSAELPAVMIALEARFVLRSRAAERRVGATEFFTGLFSTALTPGELLTAVEIPARRARAGSAFQEVARRHGDYALAGVAAELALDASGHVAACRLALLSVGDSPVLTAASASLIGQEPTADAILATSEAVRKEVDPPADIHADAAYRRQLAAVLTRRALTLAVERARAS